MGSVCVPPRGIHMAAPGSPAKPWERNRSTGTTTASSLRNQVATPSTSFSSPALPARTALATSSPYSAMRPSYGMGGSPYNSSMYGSSTYGSSMYGGSSYGMGNRYGSSYGMGSSYGGGMGSSYGGGMGSSYGGGYGGMGGGYGMGSRYGGMSTAYGNSYGGYGSTYSRYGSGYEDHNYRNPYPRGKYWSYGGGDEFGASPWGPAEPQGSLLMDMEQVVEGFGHFTRILDYNFEAIHGSFASVLRLFDSMGELRRAVFYGLQGVAVFAVLGKCFRALQRWIYQLLGKSVPEKLTVKASQASSSLQESFDDQWNGPSSASRNGPPRQSRRRTQRAILLLLGFFAVLLGGPMLFSMLYRMLVGSKKSTGPLPPTAIPQAKALYDFPGEAEGDLPFHKDDILTIRRPVGTGWLEGELDGRVGLVPESYVTPHHPNGPPHPHRGPLHSQSQPQQLHTHAPPMAEMSAFDQAFPMNR